MAPEEENAFNVQINYVSQLLLSIAGNVNNEVTQQTLAQLAEDVTSLDRSQDGCNTVITLLASLFDEVNGARKASLIHEVVEDIARSVNTDCSSVRNLVEGMKIAGNSARGFQTMLEKLVMNLEQVGVAIQGHENKRLRGGPKQHVPPTGSTNRRSSAATENLKRLQSIAEGVAGNEATTPYSKAFLELIISNEERAAVQKRCTDIIRRLNASYTAASNAQREDDRRADNDPTRSSPCEPDGYVLADGYTVLAGPWYLVNYHENNGCEHLMLSSANNRTRRRTFSSFERDREHAKRPKVVIDPNGTIQRRRYEQNTQAEHDEETEGNSAPAVRTDGASNSDTADLRRSTDGESSSLKDPLKTAQPRQSEMNASDNQELKPRRVDNRNTAPPAPNHSASRKPSTGHGGPKEKTRHGSGSQVLDRTGRSQSVVSNTSTKLERLKPWWFDGSGLPAVTAGTELSMTTSFLKSTAGGLNDQAENFNAGLIRSAVENVGASLRPRNDAGSRSKSAVSLDDPDKSIKSKKQKKEAKAQEELIKLEQHERKNTVITFPNLLQPGSKPSSTTPAPARGTSRKLKKDDKAERGAEDSEKEGSDGPNEEARRTARLPQNDRMSVSADEQGSTEDAITQEGTRRQASLVHDRQNVGDPSGMGQTRSSPLANQEQEGPDNEDEAHRDAAPGVNERTLRPSLNSRNIHERGPDTEMSGDEQPPPGESSGEVTHVSADSYVQSRMPRPSLANLPDGASSTSRAAAERIEKEAKKAAKQAKKTAAAAEEEEEEDFLPDAVGQQYGDAEKGSDDADFEDSDGEGGAKSRKGKKKPTMEKAKKKVGKGRGGKSADEIGGWRIFNPGSSASLTQDPNSDQDGSSPAVPLIAPQLPTKQSPTKPFRVSPGHPPPPNSRSLSSLAGRDQQLADAFTGALHTETVVGGEVVEVEEKPKGKKKVKGRKKKEKKGL